MRLATVGEHLRYARATLKISSKIVGSMAVILASLEPFISHDVASVFADLCSKNYIYWRKFSLKCKRVGRILLRPLRNLRCDLANLIYFSSNASVAAIVSSSQIFESANGILCTTCSSHFPGLRASTSIVPSGSVSP